MADTLSINRLRIRCIIGCNPEERTTPQEILLTVHLALDCSKAGHSDNLDDTINYYALAQQLTDLAIRGKFRLIEALAESTADHCLQQPLVSQVSITVEKPAAIPNADCASIAITRKRIK